MIINFTNQEIIELGCILSESKEYKACKGHHYDYSEEEIKNMKEYLVPLFRKLGMLD
jgi:hypothetical protein